MSSDIASKNLYELLGNDPDQDPELREPPVPVKTVDKPLPRGNRAERAGAVRAEAGALETRTPGSERGEGRGRGGRGRGRGRGDYSGNERAFRDRDAGSSRNQDKPVDDGLREDRHSNQIKGGRIQGRFDGRGGRGGAGGRGGRGNRDDRHSRGIGGGVRDHAKQAAHGWGESGAEGELNDEQAGESIAKDEEKQGFDTTVDEPVNADGEHPQTNEEPAAEEAPEPEPEDKSKSYATYLAELAEKKLGLGGLLTARKANEGSTKNQPEGKALEKDAGEEYFAGSGPKARRERERKDKGTFTLEHDIQARERERDNGPRGGRGGRGGFRGEGRGRGGRGRGEGRGEYRGRGGRGGAQAGPNFTNESDFPSLGA